MPPLKIQSKTAVAFPGNGKKLEAIIRIWNGGAGRSAYFE